MLNLRISGYIALLLLLSGSGQGSIQSSGMVSGRILSFNEKSVELLDDQGKKFSIPRKLVPEKDIVYHKHIKVKINLDPDS